MCRELRLNEQSMLRDSAATFAGRQSGADRLRQLRASEAKIDRDIWAQAAEAGWLAVLAPEDAGGLALGLTDLCLVSEELGKGLIPEPVATVTTDSLAWKQFAFGAIEPVDALTSGKLVVDDLATVLAFLQHFTLGF